MKKSDKEAIELLDRAKNGDNLAKEIILKDYYGLIVFQAKTIFINGYTFDDLIQVGNESILKAIINFDLSKGISTFSPYVFWSIKNNFSNICRKEIRYNDIYSLNTVIQGYLEPIDLVACEYTLEETVFRKVHLKKLVYSLSCLDKEELELINFLYLQNEINGEPSFLSNYAKSKNQSYYYCTCLKKRALIKLKSNYTRN